MEETGVIDPAFDKLSNLDVALQQIEEAYGDSIEREPVQSAALAQARRSVVGLAVKYRQSRLNFGRALRQYKQHFEAQRGWVAAAEIIAEAVDCSTRTIFRIIRGYEMAEGLSPYLLEALEQRGIDPTAVKNTELVADLQEMLPPQSLAEANEAVAEKQQKHSARRTEKKTARKPAEESLGQFTVRIASQFETRYRTTPQSRRDSEVRFVLEYVIDELGMKVEEVVNDIRLAPASNPEMRKAA